MAPKTTRKPRRGGWVRLTAAEARTYSDENKAVVKKQLDRILEKTMKPALVRPRRGRPPFGQIFDLYTKWHGHSLVLFARRRGGRVVDRTIDDFDERCGRITIIGANVYEVACYRYPGRWWPYMSACTLRSALAQFRQPSPAWPY